MTGSPTFRTSRDALVLFALVTALLVAWGCVEKDEEDVDLESEGESDETQTICGRDWETELQPFFDAYCVRCHSEYQQGSARNGAPEGYNWDSQDEVLAAGELIIEQLRDDGAMPPSAPYPGKQDKDRIISWLDCALSSDDN
ncbi:MAG: hypothetical protein KJ042_02330 [Deltaproteobacteria bacterium]|nr:hypothetical protein [Deltaproteobacteria bacterium]